MDVIGMTALPEAKMAREAEVCYAAIAMVTDYDVWHESHESSQSRWSCRTFSRTPRWASASFAMRRTKYRPTQHMPLPYRTEGRDTYVPATAFRRKFTHANPQRCSLWRERKSLRTALPTEALLCNQLPVPLAAFHSRIYSDTRRLGPGRFPQLFRDSSTRCPKYTAPHPQVRLWSGDSHALPTHLCLSPLRLGSSTRWGEGHCEAFRIIRVASFQP